MLNIVKAPDAKLRVKTRSVKKITPALLKTIQEMIKVTKKFIDPEGVGLASTQVGNDEQYFISKSEDNTFTAVLNPEITSSGKRTKVFFEGCLSIPNYYGEVTRPTSIKVKYMDINGQMISKSLTGLDAWIFQHEYDHLNGTLFVDLVLAQKSKLYKVVGRDRAGAELFEEVTL